MAETRNARLITKRTSVPGKIPTGTTGDESSYIRAGELASNLADRSLWGYDGTNVFEYGSNSFLGLTGGTISGSLSANSLSVDYIDFNTGVTVLNNTGRVYFDDTEKALSYYPDENNDIVVRIGQQTYSRVYNATGSLIPKGSAVKIQSATNSIPNITLAIASNNSGNNQVAGLVVDDIMSGETGFIINQGLLSGLTINTFNIGDIIYLSDSIPGGLVSSTSSLNFNSRTNQIGYIISTGTSTGQIYVNINNEDINLTLTDKERNILEGNAISTGVYEFTGLTKASSTTFNISPVKGWVVRNTYEQSTLPDVTNIIYSGQTGLTTPYLTTSDSTFVLLTTGATISLQPNYPTPQERRENIFLGKIVHPDRTSILLANNTTDYDVSPMSALRDMFTPIKLTNDGVLISPNGANLHINQSAGFLWGMGINWANNQLDPNRAVITAQTQAIFQYRTQTGGTFSNTTVIDTSNYDVNGSVTSIPGAGSYTTQRIYIFPTGLVRIQYGQNYYTTLAKALAGLPSETFVEYSNNSDNGILVGLLTVKDGTTDLSNTNDAIFTNVSKFGELIGGTAGISTTTLQQAYENSITPEILINSALDGLDIQNGTGNADNLTPLIKGVSASGATTSILRADGYVSGTTLDGNVLLSGGTNLYSIFSTTDTNDITRVQPGTNITTGGTANNPIVNLSESPSVNNLTFSGTAIGGTVQAGSGSFTSLSATTLSGGTIISGGTNLYNIFSPLNLISNPLDDRILTSLGTSNTSNAEANLRFNGNTLTVIGQSSAGTLSDTAALSVSGYGSFSHNIFSFSGGTADRYVLAGAADFAGNFRYAGIRYDRANNVAKFGNYFNQLGEAGYIAITSGGTVGIGTVNPQARLHLNNITTGATVLFEDSTNPDFTPFIIDTNGLVGVGILNPTERLQVSGNTTISGTLTVSGITSGTSETRVLVSDSTGLVKYLSSSAITGSVTYVQPGTNITTGGTANLPVINLTASPSVNNLTFSGTAIGGTVQAGAGSFTSLSATTLSGGTILSGGTNLYNIFATIGSGSSGSYLPLSGGVLTGPITAQTIEVSSGSSIKSYSSTATTDSIAFGSANLATGSTSSSIGGTSNKVHSNRSGIFAGSFNSISGGSGVDSVIAGATNSSISQSNASFVGGGYTNNINNTQNASIVGGTYNTINSAAEGFIGGGNNNLITGQRSSVIGGTNNTVSGDFSAILGGNGNTASNNHSIVIGAGNSTASGNYSFIFGGTSVTASGNNSTAIGGYGSNVSGNYATAVAGFNNQVTGTYSSILAGNSNTNNGISSSIVGGTSGVINASNSNSSIIGGNGNFVAASRTVVLGGQGISATTSDSVYVPKLNVGILTGTSISNLGIDANGFIVSGATVSGVSTQVQPGSNITTGGTSLLPVVSLSESPSVNNLTFSGTAIGGTVQAGAGSFTSMSAGTLSGGTIISGGTNLYSIFQPLGSSSNYIKGTANIDFGNESSSSILTINSALITQANINSCSFIHIETSETSLDDFILNGVSFNIENIVDNVSFDIRGTAINNASGIYTIKYLIGY
jgi:hypothetical protein